jgi:uncharacterized protein with von Willebrand factor type A (vWA) domain
LKGYVCV